jgi:putative transcriptional regulator
MMLSMIRLDVSSKLEGRSLYWLAKTTGMPYSTVHKLGNAQTYGISFDVLDKLCDALGCEPGDLLVRVSKGKKTGGRKI